MGKTRKKEKGEGKGRTLTENCWIPGAKLPYLILMVRLSGKILSISSLQQSQNKSAAAFGAISSQRVRVTAIDCIYTPNQSLFCWYRDRSAERRLPGGE